MVVYRWVLFCFLLSAFCFSAVLLSEDKSIKIELSARWPDTSVIAEISEFFADESQSLFWEFIEQLSTPETVDQLASGTPKEQYDIAISVASGLLKSAARTDLLKFALALREYSPRVETFRQLGVSLVSKVPKDCTDAFVDIYGSITCDISKITGLLSKDFGGFPPDVYECDHHYPGTKQVDEKRVILYGVIGTKQFSALYKNLRNRARDIEINFLLRHYPSLEAELSQNLRLSGYGVELAIKSTEYKAQDDTKVQAGQGDSSSTEDEQEVDLNGFDFRTLKEKHPVLREHLNEFKTHLLDAEELTPLKVWQLQELGYQASQRIVSASPALDSINVLRDLSQNFPVAARQLSKTLVHDEVREEIALNQQAWEEAGMQTGTSYLYINGLHVDLDSLDVYGLLDLLRQEERLAAGFFYMGYRREYISMLTAVDLSAASASGYAIDTRLGYPDFINDLDRDKQYKSWGNSVKMMLQPYFPGMLRPVARNFFTLVFVVDPAARDSRLLTKIAYSFFAHEIPLRVGFVWAVDPTRTVSGFDDVSVAMLNYYNFAKSDRGVTKAVKLLIDVSDGVGMDTELKVEDVLKAFKKKFPGEDVDLVFGKDSDYDGGRQAWAEFVAKSGLRRTPKVLLNGVPLDEDGLTGDRFEETVINEVMRITPRMQKDIFHEKITDKTNVADYLLDQPNVMPRLNERILGKNENDRHLDMVDTMEYYPTNAYEFRKLLDSQKTAYMIKKLKYLTKFDELEVRPFTLWVVADVESADGRLLFYNALRALKHSKNLRLGLIHNPARTEVDPVITKALQTAIMTLPNQVAKNFITKLVKEENYAGLKAKKTKLEDLAVSNMDMAAFRSEYAALKDDYAKIHAHYCQQVLELRPGEQGVVANGRVLAPLQEPFVEEDVALLEKFTLSAHSDRIKQVITEWNIENTEDKASDVIMRTASLLMSQSSRKRRHNIVFDADEKSVVNIPASDITTAIIDVVFIVNPLSREAQRFAPLLSTLVNVVNADIRLAMNPEPKLSQLPLRNFYRAVVEPEIQFAPDGSRKPGPSGYFTALPRKQLLTLNLEVPEAWMVEPVRTDYDLDNIRMDQVETDVSARYELEYILLEGHCYDEITGSPPRGLQFTLGTQQDPAMVDTIVMANLGYFQLKANPGAWILQLREGRSAEIYQITSEGGKRLAEGQESMRVVLDRFSGKTTRIQVRKKPDKLDEELLRDSKDKKGEEEESWVQKVAAKLPGMGKTSDAPSDPTINIFSLASGHLYERFLRIMMLSVVKHTQHPVKFWFLKNFLSPAFKSSLPPLAAHYGFKYELVQYKWPRWLHHESEKQRLIWGYKILFLDVLFPLNLEKIIFVDADQVVRADMWELMSLPLEDAPYGYAPFCDSRREMDGYRFWKQGYWSNHLNGRNYHISALYVVDLRKFRQIAAGDRLRGQYQGLSNDPNSLSNLDQDLPNNMIHQVKIKTLPSEWLWCETWCDERSKASAKTIDLCNNPMTKEPKLTSAQRIIAEWTEYDQEIKRLIGQDSPAPPPPSDEHKHREL